MSVSQCSECGKPCLGTKCAYCAIDTSSKYPPCKNCGEPMCQAFRERILPGRSSYACALRQIEKLQARVAELEAENTSLRAEGGTMADNIEREAELALGRFATHKAVAPLSASFEDGFVAGYCAAKQTKSEPLQPKAVQPCRVDSAPKT